MNPNYSVIPCFVKENLKTTLKIYVISNKVNGFLLQVLLAFPTLSQNTNSLFHLIFLPLFSRTFPLLNHPKSHHYNPKQQEFKI